MIEILSRKILCPSAPTYSKQLNTGSEKMDKTNNYCFMANFLSNANFLPQFYLNFLFANQWPYLFSNFYATLNRRIFTLSTDLSVNVAPTEVLDPWEYLLIPPDEYYDYYFRGVGEKTNAQTR